jgi:hypothetical protein
MSKQFDEIVCGSRNLFERQANAGGPEYGLQPCTDCKGHGSKHERYAAGSEQPPFIDLTHSISLDVANYYFCSECSRQDRP